MNVPLLWTTVAHLKLTRSSLTVCSDLSKTKYHYRQPCQKEWKPGSACHKHCSYICDHSHERAQHAPAPISWANTHPSSQDLEKRLLLSCCNNQTSWGRKEKRKCSRLERMWGQHLRVWSGCKQAPQPPQGQCLPGVLVLDTVSAWCRTQCLPDVGHSVYLVLDTMSPWCWTQCLPSIGHNSSLVSDTVSAWCWTQCLSSVGHNGSLVLDTMSPWCPGDGPMQHASGCVFLSPLSS